MPHFNVRTSPSPAATTVSSSYPWEKNHRGSITIILLFEQHVVRLQNARDAILIPLTPPPIPPYTGGFICLSIFCFFFSSCLMPRGCEKMPLFLVSFFRRADGRADLCCGVSVRASVPPYFRACTVVSGPCKAVAPTFCQRESFEKTFSQLGRAEEMLNERQSVRKKHYKHQHTERMKKYCCSTVL